MIFCESRGGPGPENCEPIFRFKQLEIHSCSPPRLDSCSPAQRKARLMREVTTLVNPAFFSYTFGSFLPTLPSLMHHPPELTRRHLMAAEGTFYCFRSCCMPLAATRSPRAPSERRDAPTDTIQISNTGIPFQNNSRLTALHATGVTPIGCCSGPAWSLYSGRPFTHGQSPQTPATPPPARFHKHPSSARTCRPQLPRPPAPHSAKYEPQVAAAAVTHLRASERKMLLSDAAVEIKRTVFKCKVVRPSGKPDDSIGSLLTAA